MEPTAVVRTMVRTLRKSGSTPLLLRLGGYERRNDACARARRRVRGRDELCAERRV